MITDALRPRGVLRSAVLINLTVACIACGNGAPAPSPGTLEALPPIETVILISIDSLRADRLGAYGHSAPTSPTLDRLAAQGLRFTRAYSTTSWTLPSHAALLSGLDDYTHGAFRARKAISDAVITLPMRLAGSGVESTGFFSGPFLHPSFGFGRGFERYVDATSYGWKAEGSVGGNVPHDSSHRDVTNPIVVEKVTGWLDERAARRSDAPPRSFVFIHLWDVHYDYIAPPEYVQIFDPDYEGTLDGRDFLENPEVRPDMPARDLQHLLALYDAEIRYTDDTIARLLELFDAHGMLDNSAIIVTADPGEEFFDHGRVGHGLTLHDEVLRVPLIFWVSGVRPARTTSDHVASLIDVTPTVCALFAVECGYDGLGDSLLGEYLEPNPSPGRGDALAEVSNPFLGVDLTARVDSAGVVLRDNHSGLLTYGRARGAGAPEQVLGVNEKKLESHPQEVRTAVSQMRQRSEDAKRRGVEIQRNQGVDEKPIDTRTLEQLEALGYLEPEGNRNARTPQPRER